MLELAGAGKCYNGQAVFTDFHLTLEPGQFKVLVGPSGCGKSTLFNCLTGVTALDQGTVSWKGQHLDHLGDHAAYMQQKDLLLPWFTLLENSLLPVKTGKPAKNMETAVNRADTLFDRLGLGPYKHHYPSQVSGGMRQRAALVRTLMFERDLILLDEPLSALDAITRQGLQTLLLMLQSEFNKTILMITHDIEEALILGDEVCLLTPMPMTMGEVFTPAGPKPRPFNDPELISVKGHVIARLQEGYGNVR